MRLGSICSREIVSIALDATLQEAARRMRDHHVGALVVTDGGSEGRQIVGVLSDRDLAIVALADGARAGELPVSTLLAGARLVSISEHEDVMQAISLMASAGVRRLLVTDEAGHLVGLVSFDDLLRVCSAQLRGLAEVLDKGLEREVGRRVAAPPEAAAPTLRVPAMGTAGWVTPLRGALQ